MIVQKKQIIRRIKIRRGINSQRELVIFEEGEPVYIRDTNRVWVGDNKTVGGNNQTYKSYIQTTNNIPNGILENEFVYNKNTKEGFVYYQNEMVKIFYDYISAKNTVDNDISSLNTLMYRLSTECCNDSLMLKDDDDKENIITDNKNRIKVKEF